MSFLRADSPNSTFGNPHAGIAAFRSTVSRLILRTVAAAAGTATVAIAIIHIYLGTGSLLNWVSVASAAGVALYIWWESRRPQPRTFIPLIAMLVVLGVRLLTADLFVAVMLLIPLFVIGLMGVFSLPDRELRWFTAIFFVVIGFAIGSYLVRFDTRGEGIDVSGEVWRGIVSASVGVGIGLALVALVRRENERFISQYQSLYDGVSIGLMRFSIDGRLVTGNHQVVALLGLDSVEQLEGLELGDLLYDSADLDYARSLGREGTPGRIRLRERDGDPVWVRVRVTPMIDEAGQTIGYEGFVEDLTDWIKAEETAHRAEARFATVFETAPIGMALVDSSGRVIRANRAFASLVSIDQQNATELQWSELLDGQLGNPMRFFRADEDDLEDEISVTDRRGVQRWMRLRVSLPADTDNRYAIVQMLDVTPHVELASVLREQVQAKNDFIATVSHELRTPLTAVVGFVAELESFIADPAPEVSEMLDIVAAESTSLSAIVEDLLVAARADIGQLTVRVEEVDICKTIHRVVRGSSRLAADHDASIEVGCEGLVAVADAHRVEQIMWNLVTNAIRHGGSKIMITAEMVGEHLVVQVRDNGPGVPEELGDEVFERYQSHSSSEGVTPSMGLGLFVARNLASRMGGDLSIESVDGSTCFSLKLPARMPVESRTS